MEKAIKTYLNAVRRRLNLPKDIKNRCISDLQTTIQARMENGESWEEIQSSLGTPKEVTAELSEQMKEYIYRKSPWRYIFLALAILCALWLAWYLGLTMFAQLLANEAASIGIIGGADGPTAIFITTKHGFDWDILLVTMLMVGGIWGFLRLRKCKPKQ